MTLLSKDPEMRSTSFMRRGVADSRDMTASALIRGSTGVPRFVLVQSSSSSM